MKILLVQTAFIGDAILATALVETLHVQQPNATVDILVRRGNEGLLVDHPYIRRVWVWDKRRHKYRHLWQCIRQIRRERYDWVFNCQRFAASGLLTAFSGAAHTVGFSKNPLSFAFTHRVPHSIGTGVHEVERNGALLRPLLGDVSLSRPALYPSPTDVAAAQALVAGQAMYVCIAPTSVWFTKQWPAHQWIALIEGLPAACYVVLLGAPADRAVCEQIAVAVRHGHVVYNAAGELSLLASAALMRGAAMNYVNDSAPLHLASAMNAPTAAVFCATVPAFGFGPLSEQSTVVETAVALKCRPCGLHGRKHCPEGHFACAETIQTAQFPLLERI